MNIVESTVISFDLLDGLDLMNIDTFQSFIPTGAKVTSIVVEHDFGYCDEPDTANLIVKYEI